MMGVNMNVVIGRPSSNMESFLNKIEDPKILVKDICKIKFIKDPIILIIPFDQYLENGFISKTGLFLEEALLMLKIKKVIYMPLINSSKVEVLCSKYHIEMSQSL